MKKAYSICKGLSITQIVIAALSALSLIMTETPATGSDLLDGLLGIFVTAFIYIGLLFFCAPMIGGSLLAITLAKLAYEDSPYEYREPSTKSKVLMVLSYVVVAIIMIVTIFVASELIFV